jgi:DNA-binding NarL/FixJ family response regulator
MTILIVDDEERDRLWLKNLLKNSLPNCDNIEEAKDGEQAVEMAVRLNPTLIFLDIKMPKLSGIKAAESILKKSPEIGIIMLSNFSDEVYVRQLWKIVPTNGSFAYVLKNASDDQVVEAAQAVLSGDCWIHPGIARVIQRTQNKAINLTNAEYEALICISLGLTDHTIASKLYITEKAVQSRLKSLYTKLALGKRDDSVDLDYNQRCRAVYIASQRGLINQSELADWEVKIITSKTTKELSE